MKNLLLSGVEYLEKNIPFVLGVIVEKHGSAPRGVGAAILVPKEGPFQGTVGGGSVEHHALLKARELLEKKEHDEHTYVLTQNEVEDIGMVCGGNNRIAFVYGAPEEISLWRELLEVPGGAIPLFYGKERTLPIVPLEDLPRREEVKELDGKPYFIFRNNPRVPLYIFGGGHVSRALVHVALPLEFSLKVCEDREDFLNPLDFAGVEELHLVDYEDFHLPIGEEDFVCIMTRGHAKDTAVALEVLKKNPRYVGIIGSKRKVARMKEDLRKAGVSQEKVASLNAPIGLPIGAETPAEIAVSIAAELIEKLRKG